MTKAYSDGTPLILWRDGIPIAAMWSPDAAAFVRTDAPEPVVGATECEPIGSLERNEP